MGRKRRREKPAVSKRSKREARISEPDLLNNGFSSDDDLPSVFELEDRVQNFDDFKLNDIVWAKYRTLYWPAVVLKLYHAKKRLKVMFVDAPEDYNHISVSYSKVIPYGNNQESKDLLQQDAADASLVAKLNDAVATVDDFLRKRFLKGNMTTPSDFFQCPLLYAVKQKSEEEDDDAQQPRIAEDVAEVQEVADARAEEVPEKVVTTTTTTCSDAGNAQQNNKTTPEQIVTSIKSKPCLNHLLDILNGKIKCERHSKFFKRLASKRKRRFRYGFGLLENSGYVDEICIHLLKMLKREVSAPLPFNPTSYILDVWVPEAIIWFLQNAQKLSLRQAERLIQNGRNLMPAFDNCQDVILNTAF